MTRALLIVVAVAEVLALAHLVLVPMSDALNEVAAQVAEVTRR